MVLVADCLLAKAFVDQARWSLRIKKDLAGLALNRIQKLKAVTWTEKGIESGERPCA